MSFVTPFLPVLREIQESLLTDRCTVVRHGTIIGIGRPCRKHKDRLFSEPGDPQDANLRSTQEWGITFLPGENVLVSDTIIFDAPPRDDVSIIAGEVLQGDTWETATRVWGTEPKVATPEVTVVLWRYNPVTDDWGEIGPVTGNIVYDRNQPDEAPVRYSPAGQAMYKHGALIVPLDATNKPEMGDRFTLYNDYAATIEMVLPGQTQHIEARFSIDVSGTRTG